MRLLIESLSSPSSLSFVSFLSFLSIFPVSLLAFSRSSAFVGFSTIIVGSSSLSSWSGTQRVARVWPKRSIWWYLLSEHMVKSSNVTFMSPCELVK